MQDKCTLAGLIGCEKTNRQLSSSVQSLLSYRPIRLFHSSQSSSSIRWICYLVTWSDPGCAGGQTLPSARVQELPAERHSWCGDELDPGQIDGCSLELAGLVKRAS